MRKFLHKLLSFAVPIPFAVIIYFTITISSGKLIRSYKIDSKVDKVFIGDSHVLTAVNDSLIVDGINFSKTSEAYYYSFYKLTHLLESNHQIKYVFLGYSYHSLASYYDSSVFGEYAPYVASDFFFFLPLKEQLKHLHYNRILIIGKKILISGISNLGQRDFSGVYGSYKARQNLSASKEAMDHRLRFQYPVDNVTEILSNLNHTYLLKIIELCKTKKVELILLNTPLHNYYKENIPGVYVNLYDSVLNSLNIKCLNFSDFTMENDCYTPDGDHCTRKGSIIFTQELIKHLNHLPSSDNHITET